MNNLGHVVRYTTGSNRAFLSKAGVMSAVAAAGSSASDINDSGVITGGINGDVFVKSGTTLTNLTQKMQSLGKVSDIDPDFTTRTGQVNASGAVTLGYFSIVEEPTSWKYSGGSFSVVTGDYPGVINDNGVVAANTFAGAAKVTKSGTVYTIANADANAINNLDQVVGYTSDDRAFIYEPGGSVVKFGPTGAVPTGISDQGIIIGHLGGNTLSSSDDYPFVYRNGVLTKLSTLVTLPAGVTLKEAVAINNNGQIAVNASKSGAATAYLLSPLSVTASIAGRVFNDANKNGVKNTGEVGLVNWRVYVDSNKNGVWDAGEQIAKTNSAGDYKLTGLAAGTFRVYEVRQTAWTRSLPSGVYPLGYYDLTLTSGLAAINKDFGNWK